MKVVSLQVLWAVKGMKEHEAGMLGLIEGGGSMKKTLFLFLSFGLVNIVLAGGDYFQMKIISTFLTVPAFLLQLATTVMPHS